MSKVESRKEVHYRPADPYRVDNPEPGMDYAVISLDELSAFTAVGWEVIKASEYPKLFNGGGYVVDDTYRYRNHVWMHVPKNFLKERKEYYQAITDNQTRQSKEQYLQLQEGIDASIEKKFE